VRPLPHEFINRHTPKLTAIAIQIKASSPEATIM